MRIIDADEFEGMMYHEAFKNDASYDERNPMARWDSGLWIRYKMFENCLEKVPTIEPKRGEWIDKGWKGDWQFETDGRVNCWHEYECSECGFHSKGSKSNYCPNCGTDMRIKNNENN